MNPEKILIKSLPIFDNMPDAAVEFVLDAALTTTVPSDGVFFTQGERATNFFLLIKGRIKVIKVASDGQQIIVRVIGPGELFGIAMALQRTDYPATSIAAMDSIALSWSMVFWPLFIERFPQFAMAAVISVGRRLDDAHSRIQELSTQDAERRIASAVIRLVKHVGSYEAKGVRIPSPISRQDIAELSGTTLHTVSRVLTAWEEKGLVEGGRQKLFVRNLQDLKALAENSL